MKYEANTIYHVYNQGNNKQKIFFKPENYQYFKRKIAKHIRPYADILAYCLMPNHFHLLIRTNESAIQNSNASCPFSRDNMERIMLEHAISQRLDIERNPDPFPARQSNLSHSIGQMLSSYAKAINHQEQRSGSLFRQRTQAKDGSKEHAITLAGDVHEFFIPLEAYWQTCFDYINDNPVVAGLCHRKEDWPHSSVHEFNSPSYKDLVNHHLVEQLGLNENYKSRVKLRLRSVQTA